MDVLFSERRDMAAARAFFRSAQAVTGITPDRVTTDGHDSYSRTIRTELGKGVRHWTSHYMNNWIEQDRRGIKGRYRPMRGFKCPRSAARFCRGYDELRNLGMHAHHRTHLPPLRRDTGLAQLAGASALADPFGRRPGFAARIGDADVAAEADNVAEAQFVEEGEQLLVADLMMRVYAAMAQKERELISERTRAALAAAKARGAVLGGDRGYRPSAGPCAAAAAKSRAEEADRTAHRLLLELATLRDAGVETHQGLARALTERGVPTPRGALTWTHTTVARLVARVGT